jgi:hypothetical protein
MSAGRIGSSYSRERAHDQKYDGERIDLAHDVSLGGHGSAERKLKVVALGKAEGPRIPVERETVIDDCDAGGAPCPDNARR